MNPYYLIVAERAGHFCEYCRAPEAVSNFPFEIDHFDPLSKGGSKEPENLVLSCRSCNAFKAFHQIGLIKDTGSVRLFNPRRDVWDEHFQFDRMNYEVTGLTEIGSGTVNRLQLNSPAQIQARELWVKFGIFP